MTKLSAVHFVLLLLFISGFWSSRVVVVGEDSLHADMAVRTHYNGGSQSSNVDYDRTCTCDTTISIGRECTEQQCQVQCDLKLPDGGIGYCSTIYQYARCRCRHFCQC